MGDAALLMRGLSVVINSIQKIVCRITLEVAKLPDQVVVHFAERGVSSVVAKEKVSSAAENEN